MLRLLRDRRFSCGSEPQEFTLVSKYSKKSILLQLIDGMARSVVSATSCDGGVVVFLTRAAAGFGSGLISHT